MWKRKKKGPLSLEIVLGEKSEGMPGWDQLQRKASRDTREPAWMAWTLNESSKRDEEREVGRYGWGHDTSMTRR